jgi:hypothetical protein
MEIGNDTKHMGQGHHSNLSRGSQSLERSDSQKTVLKEVVIRDDDKRRPRSHANGQWQEQIRCT